jgi:CRISPR-associated protein Cmr6
MPIAAVPGYLAARNNRPNTLLQKASPGMQFTQYLAIYLEKRWHKQNSAKKAHIHISRQDQRLMKAWRSRLKAQAVKETFNLLFPAVATAPFVTGMGNEHPLENGLSFLWPYGVPYLPGSGVKGVIRQAFRELSIDGDTTSALLGLESERGGQDHRKGALIFHDVIPEIQSDRLKVEIMTPHFNDYYQKGLPPHENGDPEPIYFLTVPEGSRFDFMVSCDEAFLSRLAPDLLAQQDGQARWQLILQQAFEYAFDWLGFGAKTRVGYGAMQADQKAMADLEYEKAQAEKQAQLVLLTDEQRLIMELKGKLSTCPVDTLRPGAEHFDAFRQVFEQAESWDETSMTELVREVFIPWWKTVSPGKKWQNKNKDKFPHLFQKRQELING